ncbi:CAF1-domain-containing protein [Balamuthia mandrillaris]
MEKRTAAAEESEREKKKKDEAKELIASSGGRWLMQKGSHSVGIVEVTRENWETVKPSILAALREATFVALDTEFSGLGADKRGRMAQNLEDRYQAISKVVQSHSLLQLGVSIFKRTSALSASTSSLASASSMLQKAAVSPSYEVQTFNFWLHGEGEFTVTAASMAFLAESGIDLNYLFSKGIPFAPVGCTAASSSSNGTTKRSQKQQEQQPLSHPKIVLDQIMASQLSIVLHNGFMDLIYLYHSFIGKLPQQLSQWVGSMAELFPRIYDTKYITDYHTSEQASYLEYLYFKCERNDPRSSLRVEYLPQFTVCVPPEVWNEVAVSTTTSNTLQRCCEQYANHGWCSLGSCCPDSHDIERILDQQAMLKEAQASAKSARNKRKRRKRRHKANQPTTEKKNEEDEEEDGDDGDEEEEQKKAKEKEDEKNQNEKLQRTKKKAKTSPQQGKARTEETGTKEGEEALKTIPTQDQLPAEHPSLHIGKMHSAGFDAFATGFIYTVYMSKFGAAGMHALGNHVYLVGKDFPLKIQKSSFAPS